MFGPQSIAKLDNVIRQAQAEAGQPVDGVYSESTAALLTGEKYGTLGEALKTLDSIPVDGISHIDGVQRETALAVVYNKYERKDCVDDHQCSAGYSDGVEVDISATVSFGEVSRTPVSPAENDSNFVQDVNGNPVVDGNGNSVQRTEEPKVATWELGGR